MFRLIWRKYRRNKTTPTNIEFPGHCDHRETPQPKMYIYPKDEALELLGTVTHESIHACLPDVDDEAVDAWEQDWMRLLKRMNISITFDGQ